MARGLLSSSLFSASFSAPFSTSPAALFRASVVAAVAGVAGVPVGTGSAFETAAGGIAGVSAGPDGSG
jgi:hypothetical protein